MLLRRFIIISCLLIALLAVVIIPRFFLSPESVADAGPISCNLSQQPCKARLADGSTLAFRLAPSSLPKAKPLDISIGLSKPASGITMQFIGRDMDMGLQPFQLNAANPSQFAGTGQVSFCSMDPDMVWLASIEVKQADKVERVVFELKPNMELSSL